MKKLAIVGESLAHSLSPNIHNYIYKKYNMNAEYSKLEFKKNNSNNIVSFLKENNYLGANVTIPYKEELLSQVDIISEEVKEIGALNVIQIKDNKSYAYNSDYFGFIRMLEYHNIDIKDKIVYILGSGGASKATRLALKNLKAKEIIIVSRKPKENDSDNFKFITYSDEIKGDILVNTTPIGMFPNINESPISEDIIKNFNTVVDVIYNPLETKMLKIAKKLAIKSCNGLIMLIEQAIKSNEIWLETKFDKNLTDDIKLFLEEEFK